MRTSISYPPQYIDNNTSYWERGVNPFKSDDDFVKFQSEGWVLIDWAENPSVFIADGTEYTQSNIVYVLGRNRYGRLCAVPLESLSSFKERHSHDSGFDSTVYATQDPKYGIKENRLCVMATGAFIPEDEPVFLFRAQDVEAEQTIIDYSKRCESKLHAKAVSDRAHEFNKFKTQYPERMKTPDTTTVKT